MLIFISQHASILISLRQILEQTLSRGSNDRSYRESCDHTGRIRSEKSLMKEVVLICFDLNNQNGCFQYDGKELSKFVSSNEYHYQARLGHYQNQLITVGSTTNSQSYGYQHSFAILYKQMSLYVGV